MKRCEVCGREADIHHIIHKCEGGLDFPLNYKYLCTEHHRGKNGPHRNRKTDIEYKLELQDRLQQILYKDFYSLEEIINILHLSKSSAKKIKKIKLYKEGYKTDDIVFWLMGSCRYENYMAEDFFDNMVVNFSL